MLKSNLGVVELVFILKQNLKLNKIKSIAQQGLYKMKSNGGWQYYVSMWHNGLNKKQIKVKWL